MILGRPWMPQVGRLWDMNDASLRIKSGGEHITVPPVVSA